MCVCVYYLIARYLAEVQAKVDAAERSLRDLCAQSAQPLRALVRDTDAGARGALALKNTHARQREGVKGLLPVHHHFAGAFSQSVGAQSGWGTEPHVGDPSSLRSDLGACVAGAPESRCTR